MTTFKEQMAKINEEMETSLQTSRGVIRSAINKNHQHTHNIISIALQNVALKHGLDVANSLVDEFKLTRLFNIHKVEKKEIYGIPDKA